MTSEAPHPVQIAVNGVTHPKHLHCPKCNAVVFTATAEGAVVPGNACWLDDGDTVGKVWNLLTDEQKHPDGWLPTLMVGRCRQCSAQYYAFVAAFMDASFDEVEKYLLANVDLGEGTYSRVLLPSAGDREPQEWLLCEYHTEAGVLHEHLFGPFALDDATGVIGTNGVSSCGGGRAEPWNNAAQVITSLWDDMRAYNRQRNAAEASVVEGTHGHV